MDKKEVNKKIKLLGIAWIIFLVVFILTILTFIIAPLLISSILFVFIYLPVMIYILIYKWIGRWFVALVFSFSIWLNILIILIPILGGLLALDLMKFSEDFAEDTKYMIINDNVPIFGARFDSLDVNQQSTNAESPLTVLSTEQMSQIKSEIDSEVKDKIIFLVEKEVFRDVDQIQIQDLGITITKDEIFELLRANDPNEFLVNKFSQERNMPKALIRSQLSDLGNADQIKALGLLLLFQKTIETNGPKYLIEELKNGNIKIYPKRTSLNILIKLIPTDIITSFFPETIGISDLGSLGETQQEQNKQTSQGFDSR